MARTARSEAANSAPLTVEGWVRAALDVLAEAGIDSVVVRGLSERLGVTKGSFYHHFKDRDELLQRMLENWRRRATDQIIDRIEKTGESPRARFAELMKVPFGGSRSERGAEVELSIRLWARRDPRAKAALEDVDRLRLRYIARLMEASGVTSSESRARAVLAYSYMRVSSTIIEKSDSELLALCESLLIGDC